jgi:hypothetical protein
MTINLDLARSMKSKKSNIFGRIADKIFLKGVPIYYAFHGEFAAAGMSFLRNCTLGLGFRKNKTILSAWNRIETKRGDSPHDVAPAPARIVDVKKTATSQPGVHVAKVKRRSDLFGFRSRRSQGSHADRVRSSSSILSESSRC